MAETHTTKKTYEPWIMREGWRMELWQDIALLTITDLLFKRLWMDNPKKEENPLNLLPPKARAEG